MNLRMGLFMNRAVYEKNIETLRKKYPVWASKLESVKRKKEILMWLQNKVIWMIPF